MAPMICCYAIRQIKSTRLRILTACLATFITVCCLLQAGGPLNQTHVKSTAVSKLPAVIGQIDKPISWLIVIDGQVIQLGTTQNKIYVTYGTPSGSVVTQKRIEWLTTVANGLGRGDEQAIVAAIHAASMALGNYENVENLPLDSPWQFLDGAPAECDEHVNLINAGVAMLGVPVNEPNLFVGQQGYLFPSTDPAVKGVGST